MSLNTHPISPFVTNNHQSWFWLNKFIEQFSKLKKKYIFGPKKTKNGELYGISLLVSYVRFSIFQSQPKELQLLKRQFCPACHAKLSPHNVVQIVFGLKSNAHHFYTEQVQICVVCVWVMWVASSHLSTCPINQKGKAMNAECGSRNRKTEISSICLILERETCPYCK